MNQSRDRSNDLTGIPFPTGHMIFPPSHYARHYHRMMTYIHLNNNNNNILCTFICYKYTKKGKLTFKQKFFTCNSYSFSSLLQHGSLLLPSYVCSLIEIPRKNRKKKGFYEIVTWSPWHASATGVLVSSTNQVHPSPKQRHQTPQHHLTLFQLWKY